jgi:hypothetical protein
MKTVERQRVDIGENGLKASSATPLHVPPFVPALLLCLVTALVVGRHITTGDFWWSDASRHAMDGVFFLDAARDLPFRQPHAYAERYYAQYPALGFVFYPPMFAVAEALFFAVFGISALTARLTVLIFAWIAVLFWYFWIQRLAGRAVAFVSGILFVCSPMVVYWARDVMLEMPTTAFLIASCFFADQFVRSRNVRCLYACVVLGCLAAWTKQTALFIMPALMIYVTLTQTPRFWLTKPAWISIAWGGVLLLPLAAYTLYLGGEPMKISVGDVHLGVPRNSWRGITYYLSTLPEALALPVLALAIIGLALMLKSPDRQRWLLPLLWALFYYPLFWFISYKEPRYVYFWLPPFALFAAWGAIYLVEKIPSRAVALSVMTLFCLYRVATGYATPTPHVSGYADAAAYVTTHPQGQVMMFDGYYAGCFIFHVRRLDPQRSRLVLRGDKMFNPVSVRKDIGQVTLVHSPEEIRKLLDDYGVNQIVLENGPPLSPASHMLRDIVKSEDFTQVKEWKIDSQDSHNIGNALLLYERKKILNVQKQKLNILIPAFGRTIEVPLSSTHDH